MSDRIGQPEITSIFLPGFEPRAEPNNVTPDFLPGFELPAEGGNHKHTPITDFALYCEKELAATLQNNL